MEPANRSFFANLFRRPAPLLPAKKIGAPQRPFQAVSVISDTLQCNAAVAIKGRRLLAREAPRLPLADCTMDATCACKYEKYDDRRTSPRRVAEISVESPQFQGQDRRQSKGRRANDRSLV